MSENNDQALEPIKDIDSLTYDTIGNLWWIQKTGMPIRLGDMADSHLRNTALMLMGFSHQKFNASDSIKVQWLTALRMEWERRALNRSLRP